MYNALHEKRIARDLNRILTDQAPTVKVNESLFVKPKGVDFWKARMYDVQMEKMVIYLRSDVGCSYGVRTGGCAGCKHWKIGTAGKKLDYPKMYTRQYQSAVEQYGVRPVMCIFNEGNMLNSEEIPEYELLAIIQDLSKRKVKRLIIESRPEYITENILRKIKNHAGEMEIEVGIGLESENDFVRNEIFLKGIQLKSFETSVKELIKFGIRSLAYVLLKPPFLNEVQAIYDAINTSKYAFSVGVSAVSLEPVGVEPYTLTDLLYLERAFKPAKLWSVIHCVNEIHSSGEVRIGGYQFKPRPVTLPSNCDRCTEEVTNSIEKWNSTYDLLVLNEQYCSCFDQYKLGIKNLTHTLCEKKLSRELKKFVEKYMKKGK